MLRILLRGAIVIVVLATLTIVWYWRGRDLTFLVDRFQTIDELSRAIKTVTYEGSGTGGLLQLDDVAMSLNEIALGGAQPNIGTTKDGQLALSFNGEVFPFGHTSSEGFSATVSTEDVALFSVRHSALPWPDFLEMNFMTGRSPSWKRFSYQRLTWKKSSGQKLEMTWRYENFFYTPDGWTGAAMSDPGLTGLIRVEISNATR